MPNATGRYVLLERIGIGGMAEVFRATARGAEGFERPIAIKRILPHLSENDDFVQMFVDEAKIAVQLQHPNIVQIFDLGRDDTEYFIAMEYVHGKDLRAVQDRVGELQERIPISVALHLAMKICEALHHAHFATGPGGQPLSVVHRDVTPQNVLLSYDGEVKVTDFGLARAAGRVTQTQSGVVKGKLAYMAPEAFSGMRVDHRSDVFGVGVLLWEMLTGRRLFLGRNDIETVELAQRAQVPLLSSLDPEIPEEVDRVVLRALARDREDRYQTAEELHDELEAFAYSCQQFVTSSALAGWLRERFPVEEAPPPKRSHEIATREIRLAELEARSAQPDPIPPRYPEPRFENLLAEAVPFDSVVPESLPPESIPPDDSLFPEPDDEAFAEEADAAEGFAADAAEGFAADAAEVFATDAAEGFAEDDADEETQLFDDDTDMRDTVQPPAPEQFDDTTGKLAPRVIEAPTEQRYDRDLASTTIPRAPGVPKVSPFGWDEGEDMTEISNLPPKRRT